jgi:hypothetical protein
MQFHGSDQWKCGLLDRVLRDNPGHGPSIGTLQETPSHPALPPLVAVRPARVNYVRVIIIIIIHSGGKRSQAFAPCLGSYGPEQECWVCNHKGRQ